MTIGNKILDSFTDTDGVLITAHTPDKPSSAVGWIDNISAQIPTIQSNKLVGFASKNYDIISTFTSTIAVGDELFADIKLPTVGSFPALDFYFCLQDQFVGPGYNVLLDSQLSGPNTMDISLYDYGTGTLTSITAIPWTAGQEYRFGITFLDTATFQFWQEPAGGGARTILGTLTTATDYTALPAGYFRLRSEYDGATSSFDNFTLYGVLSSCFPTTYTCVQPTLRMQPDDSCVAQATLVAY